MHIYRIIPRLPDLIIPTYCLLCSKSHLTNSLFRENRCRRMKCDKGPVDITGLKIVVCFGVKLSNAYLSMRTRDRYYLLVSPVLGGNAWFISEEFMEYFIGLKHGFLKIRSICIHIRNRYFFFIHISPFLSSAMCTKCKW